MTDVPAVPRSGKVQGGGDALDPGPALPPGAGPGSEPDDLGVLDPDWLALLQAAARSGHLCHECHSPVSPEDALRLLGIAEAYLRHRQRLRAAQQGFSEGLAVAVERLSRRRWN